MVRNYGVKRKQSTIRHEIAEPQAYESELRQIRDRLWMRLYLQLKREASAENALRRNTSGPIGSPSSGS
jgi:hypothetical protein